MKLKTTLAALALVIAPGLAAAQCSYGEKASVTASACGEGQVYDAATASCVLKPTS
jgi:hypothetical protein